MKHNLCKHINKPNVITFSTVTSYFNVSVTFMVLRIFNIYTTYVEALV